MNKLHIVLAIGILMAGTAAAQNLESSGDIDTVILVSTSNYPDAMISASPAEKLGIPVLLTDRDQLSTAAENAINQYDPSNVILVGGPAVISEDVQAEVDTMANTTRLWGTTQIGTSIEVSNYFWTSGSEKVTIVQYPQDQDGHRLLASVKNEVEGDGPILISKEGTLSANVLAEAERLGATEAEVYSTNAVNVTEDLESVGVQNIEVEESEQDTLEEQLKQRTDVQNKSELVIVAAANFRDTISVPVSPNGASYIVSSEDQIDGAVDVAAQTDENTSIKVVGKPDLASQIAERIESETDKEVERVSGPPEEVAAGDVERNQRKWERKQEREMSEWKNEIENNPGLQNAANQTLQRAKNRVDNNSSEEVREMLQRAEDAYEDGDYFEARKLAIRAASNAHVETYQNMDREEIRERVREEREDMKEAAMELRESNQEMAQELREAETQQERLEIIREFREERRETINEIREEARERNQNRGRESDQERERETEREVENGTDSKLRLRLDDSELKLDASYTGNTGGYTVDKQMTVEDGTIEANFNFQPPTGPATQVITEYEADMERTLEDGTYEVVVTLQADGETLETIQDSFTVPGELDVESETKAEMDAGGNTVELEAESSASASTEEDSSNSTETVRYTDSGFMPQTVTVEKGDTVVWEDESDSDMWVASDVHPTHREYDGTSTSQHCEDGSSDTFDQCESGDEYRFTFNKEGEWSYHNHMQSGHTGTVVVE